MNLCKCGDLSRCPACFHAELIADAREARVQQLSEIRQQRRVIDFFRATQGRTEHDSFLIQRSGCILLANAETYNLTETPRGRLVGSELGRLECMTIEAKMAHIRYLLGARQFETHRVPILEPSTGRLREVGCLSYKFKFQGREASLMRIKRAELLT